METKETLNRKVFFIPVFAAVIGLIVMLALAPITVACGCATKENPAIGLEDYEGKGVFNKLTIPRRVTIYETTEVWAKYKFTTSSGESLYVVGADLESLEIPLSREISVDGIQRYRGSSVLDVSEDSLIVVE